MPLLSVTAAKIRADSSLGFSYKSTQNEGIFITNVNPEGTFGRTHLKPGQQIISINGTNVSRVDTSTFKAVLASLPAGDVTIVIKTHEEELKICSVTFDCVCNVVKQNDTSIQRVIYSKMKSSADIIPETLLLAGVPRDVWFLIYSLVEEELMPVSLACFKANEEYSKEMFIYKRDARGALKPSAYLTVQKSTANMIGVQTGILHNNVTLVATALKDRVNSILAKYNVMSAIATKEFNLPKYKQTSSNTLMLAVGLSFYPMNFLTISATPIFAASAASAPLEEDVPMAVFGSVDG